MAQIGTKHLDVVAALHGRDIIADGLLLCTFVEYDASILEIAKILDVLHTHGNFCVGVWNVNDTFDALSEFFVHILVPPCVFAVIVSEVETGIDILDVGIECHLGSVAK